MTTATQQAVKTVWTIDPSHSTIEFQAKHMMFTTVKGRFAGIEGAISFDESNPANSSARAIIDVTSIDTRAEQRDTHLKSADFFDVEQYPTITFESTRIELEGRERARVTGNLTVKDVTKPVVLDVTLNGFGVNPWGQRVAGFTAETTINRKEFGLNWNVALETGGVLVGDTIKIAVEVQASAQ